MHWKNVPVGSRKEASLSEFAAWVSDPGLSVAEGPGSPAEGKEIDGDKGAVRGLSGRTLP